MELSQFTIQVFGNSMLFQLFRIKNFPHVPKKRNGTSLTFPRRLELCDTVEMKPGAQIKGMAKSVEDSLAIIIARVFKCAFGSGRRSKING